MQSTTKNSQNRLKLQKLNSDSSQFYNKDKKQSNDIKKVVAVQINHPSSSPEDNDSLFDFKSPPRNDETPKFKIEKQPLKCKKKLLGSKSKSKPSGSTAGKSKSKQRKVVDRKQPLIESSFFKPKVNDSPKLFVCPLCFKNSKDEANHIAHAKSCAAKNNYSSEELLAAIALQERQADERRAMGLLSAPLIPQQQKKPSTARLKKFVRLNIHPDIVQ